MSRILIVCVALVTIAGSALAGSAEEANKAKVMQFYDEVINTGNMDIFNDFVDETFVEHEPFPGLGTDRESCRQFFTMMRDAFPDLMFQVNFMVAEGDKVVAYVTMSGTHKKEFAGMPASGKKFSTSTIDIVRIVDGKAVEHWGVTDAMTMMQQLGAMPEMAPAGQ